MTDANLVIVGVSHGLDNPRATLAELQEFARSRGGWAQLADAEHVAGRNHIVSAVEHARRSIDRGLGASGKFELEFLLYLSGERQLSKAIEIAGVRTRLPFVAVVGDGPTAAEILERFRWTTDESVIKAGAKKLRALGFSSTEIEAAGAAAADLALERVARVDLLK